MEHLRAIPQQASDRSQALREKLLGPDGKPLSSAWAAIVLVLMAILLREPRAFLAPCAKPGPVGDVLEAPLAFCDPRDKVRAPVRDEFGKTRGIAPRGVPRA